MPSIDIFSQMSLSSKEMSKRTTYQEVKEDIGQAVSTVATIFIVASFYFVFFLYVAS